MDIRNYLRAIKIIDVSERVTCIQLKQCCYLIKDNVPSQADGGEHLQLFWCPKTWWLHWPTSYWQGILKSTNIFGMNLLNKWSWERVCERTTSTEAEQRRMTGVTKPTRWKLEYANQLEVKKIPEMKNSVVNILRDRQKEEFCSQKVDLKWYTRVNWKERKEYLLRIDYCFHNYMYLVWLCEPTSKLNMKLY